jgi:light-regulated signal transduction histidine kinase (bacteriophytochrome)
LVQANDITEQREGEKRLKKINDTLLREKRAAKSLAAELTRSNEELEQFAYVASHDLQEPLRMLASYVELLESKLEGTLDTKTVRYMGYITEGARRLQNLINDLLLVSRVNSEGKKPQPADSREVVTEALSLLRPSIEEANAAITLKQLPTVTVDKIQLRQVFQNLIGNSLKYRGVDRAHISVGADREEHGWKFWVQDNGIGIEAKHHERVFLIFKRLHRRDGCEGSGIGLALVKKIVERHGGQVGIEAPDARGCMVWFTIPEPPAKAGEVLDSP